MNREKKIMILGSTGSVGRQAADVALKSGYRVTALSGRRSVRAIEEQIRLFRPERAAMTDDAAAEDLRVRVADLPTKIYRGADGLCEMISEGGADAAVNAVMGSAGLRPTLAVIDSGMRLCLANKESVVMAGRSVMKRAADRGCLVAPVDSEHSAIFQCLDRTGREFAEELIITASGGPFRGKKRDELKDVTAEAALAHPTWSMGASITIDSATLMNKGFEMIEASRLFGFSAKDISVVVHPQSIVHSMVRFRDNSVIAQLSVPDMRLCVEYAVEYPERGLPVVPRLDLCEAGKLDFSAPDEETFTTLGLARNVIDGPDTGGALLHAANETAVSLFLSGGIGFTDIFDVLGYVTDRLGGEFSSDSLEDIFEADAAARKLAESFAREISRKR